MSFIRTSARISLSAGLLAGAAYPALAVETSLPAKAVVEVDAMAAAFDGRDIIVTGKLDGYRTILTTTGTKTSTPVIDVPQSISVVTRDQIDDQSIRSMADLVRLVPGVSAGQGEGHRDQVTLRGNVSTADFFVDGLRDDVQHFRSFYNVDRVEVHKGPNAMIFGRGGGGGLINRISKGAMIGETALGGDAGIDSFGGWLLGGDANFALGDAAGFRINGFVEALDNHRDAFSGDRWAINPVVGAELSETFKVQLGYEHADDDRVVDRGVPSQFGGTIAAPAGPVRGFRDSFFGVRGVSQTQFNADIVRARAEYRLTDSLTLSAQGLWGDYDKVYANTFASAPVSATGTVNVQAYRDVTLRRSAVGQTNLEWRGTTGAIDHVLLIGAELTGQDTASERINGFFDASLNSASRTRTIALAVKPNVPVPTFVAGVTGNGNAASATELAQRSFYVQDQIGLTDWFDVIAGVRYDVIDIDARDRFSGAVTGRTDKKWSPRLGVVVKPNADASLYASYSRTFLPQSGDQFTSLSVSNAALAPEKFTNWEIGAKWNVTPRLTATAALYQLDRTNTRAAGPVAGTVVLTGEQRTKGFEIALNGKLTDAWQISAGYGYTDAEITRTTTAAPAGRAVAQVPRHQVSLWNRYDFDDRIGVGVGVYHQAKSFTAISNAVVLPAYTRVDAALFFAVNDRIEAQVNVENLLGETYFPTAHNDQNISTGAPRNARLTLRFKL